MTDLVLSGTNVSSAVRSAFKGRLQAVSVWRDGSPHPCDGFVETSTGGGRATVVPPRPFPLEQPMAGDELTVGGDPRRWRILNVSGVPGVSWTCDLARGLEDAASSFQPVELAVAAFSTYVQLTVLPPAVLARGHRLFITWRGPTSGSLYSTRGIIQVPGLSPSSAYEFTAQEFDANGRPSEVARFNAETTS